VIKDRPLKEMLYRHFRARGWMAQPEVPVLVGQGVAPNSPPVTDIDVLGIRPSEDLRWKYVVGDCKTLKKQSPVNRVLWARGLMDGIGATTGIVLLRREFGTEIHPDHKLYADAHGVMLLEESAFEAFDRAVVYPTGSSSFPEGLGGIGVLRDDLGARFPALASFSSWIVSECWSITDHCSLLRKVLGKAREVSGEVNPARDDHLALCLEMAATFGVPFATLVGTVFRRHLLPNSRDELDEAVRVIVWGGREQYDFYDRVRARLLGSTGSDVATALALPNWDAFLELVRGSLETPRLAFAAPQVLRSLSSALADGAGPETPLSMASDRTVLNLAMRVALYVSRAAGWPRDFEDRLKQIFMPRISELASAAARQVGQARQLTLLDPPTK